MENQKYPLIFIVEDNSVYNKLIVNHLRSHKLIRTESFLSGEECLKNIDRKLARTFNAASRSFQRLLKRHAVV